MGTSSLLDAASGSRPPEAYCSIPTRGGASAHLTGGNSVVNWANRVAPNTRLAERFSKLVDAVPPRKIIKAAAVRRNFNECRWPTGGHRIWP